MMNNIESSKNIDILKSKDFFSFLAICLYLKLGIVTVFFLIAVSIKMVSSSYAMHDDNSVRFNLFSHVHVINRQIKKRFPTKKSKRKQNDLSNLKKTIYTYFSYSSMINDFLGLELKFAEEDKVQCITSNLLKVKRNYIYNKEPWFIWRNYFEDYDPKQDVRPWYMFLATRPSSVGYITRRKITMNIFNKKLISDSLNVNYSFGLGIIDLRKKNIIQSTIEKTTKIYTITYILGQRRKCGERRYQSQELLIKTNMNNISPIVSYDTNFEYNITKNLILQFRNDITIRIINKRMHNGKVENLSVVSSGKNMRSPRCIKKKSLCLDRRVIFQDLVSNQHLVSRKYKNKRINYDSGFKLLFKFSF